MKERLIYFAIILGLIILLVLQRECTPPPQTKYVTTSDTTITPKEVKGSDTLINIPIDTTKEFNQDLSALPEILIDTLYIDTTPILVVDTQAIIQMFLDTNIQKSAYSDSSLTIDFEDWITQNRIIRRELEYTFNYSDTTIHNNIVQKQRAKWFIGGMLSGGKNTLGVTPQLYILTRKDHLYHVGTNLLEEQPNLSVGIGWKLRFKR